MKKGNDCRLRRRQGRNDVNGVVEREREREQVYAMARSSAVYKFDEIFPIQNG